MTIKKSLDRIEKETSSIKTDTSYLRKVSLHKNIQIILWSIAFIATLVVGFFAGNIYFNISNINSEYDISISVEPSEIQLNEASEYIDFKFNFTNTGKNTIKNFGVISIDLYRFEKDEFVRKTQVLSNSEGYPTLKCTGKSSFSRSIDLEPGMTCSFEIDMWSNENFFDDKDKQLQLYFYFYSNPPIQNRMVELGIY
ncbi:MAG: hypothetical protein ABH828_02095 [archaeon]